MAAMTLCRLYREHGITRKAIARYKGAKEDKVEEYLEWQEQSWKELQAAWQAKEERRIRIFQLRR